MRGDGPLAGYVAKDQVMFPPRARGWTLAPEEMAENLEVSPACAGMDLGSVFADIVAACFPRVRGDGPWVSLHNPSHVRFPPRARGWTL